MFPSVCRRLGIVSTFAAVLSAILLAPAAVQAKPGGGGGPGGGSKGGCTPAAGTQVFDTTWGGFDPGLYNLFPGGSFETKANGWMGTGGTQRVPGGETVSGNGGSWSLSLPAGEAATSPTSCIAFNEPSVRFFTKGVGALLVEFVYGRTVVPGTTLALSNTDWEAIPTWIPTASAITLPTSGTATIAIKLINTGTSTLQVDDVYIDPWRRG